MVLQVLEVKEIIIGIILIKIFQNERRRHNALGAVHLEYLGFRCKIVLFRSFHDYDYYHYY